MKKLLPRYPVYVPTRGRYHQPLTIRCLLEHEVPFLAVVEPQEVDAYAAVAGRERLLVLPHADMGLIGARNFIMEHSIAAGAARHWQLDDNMRDFWTVFRARRVRCPAGFALRATEDFVDRYTNVAIAGLSYCMFYIPSKSYIPPFHLNCHVYSCTLVNNAIPYRWRLRYNDDTDMCLQVLAGGWCTVLMNAYQVAKIQTMQMRGGNTNSLYQGDGRLRMARSLERQWPGVVTTTRRFKRPQHIVFDFWRRFDTPLQLRPDLDPATLTGDPYRLELVQVAPEEVAAPSIRSAAVRGLFAPPPSPPAELPEHRP